MRAVTVVTLLLTGTTTAEAQEQRDLGAHEHGVGQLNIAFEGTEIAMELNAPGADIVGFEHPAITDEDRAKVTAAIELLENPQELFRLTGAAGCKVVLAEAELLDEDGSDHEDHGHKDDHKGHDHHDDHHGAGGHTEFRADYLFSCAAPEQVGEIEFGYFVTFPNARELEVQLISDQGSRGFEVTRDAPALDLEGAL